MIYGNRTPIALLGLIALTVATTSQATRIPAQAVQANGRTAPVAPSGIKPPPASAKGWVPRTSKRVCPGGTTTFEAGDGGVKCWAGPLN